VNKRAARKWLEQAEPLMKCGPLIEFKYRLQCLSEGMLKNHLQTHGHTPCPQERKLYRQYKEMV
jgi:hypothetical protein